MFALQAILHAAKVDRAERVAESDWFKDLIQSLQFTEYDYWEPFMSGGHYYIKLISLNIPHDGEHGSYFIVSVDNGNVYAHGTIYNAKPK